MNNVAVFGPDPAEQPRQSAAEVEQRVAERTADLTRLNRQLEQEIIERARAKQALSWEATVNGIMAEIAQSLLNSASIADTATLVIRSAQDLTHSDYGFIAYIDPATGYFTCPIEVQPVWEPFRVSTDLNAFQLPSTVRQLWSPGQQPVIINQPVEKLPVRRLLLSSAVFGSALVGLIALADADHAYTEREADFIQRLSALYALAIQRQRTEDALQSSEERFRRLFENAPLCLLEVDMSVQPPVILRANSRVRSVYDWPPIELVNTPLENLLLDSQLAELRHQLAQAAPGEALSVETIGVRRNRSAFPIRLSVTHEPGPAAGRVIIAVEDLTVEKQRRSEEEAIAEERRRIARDIHDGLAQDLAALRVRSAMWCDLIESDPAQLHAEIDALQDILRQNIQEVRRSIFALRSAALDELGFWPALRQFAAEFGEQNRLNVELQVNGAPERLRPNLEPAVFRIVQEALNNVGKHACAQHVQVELDFSRPSLITLTVRDDGRGFDLAELTAAAERGRVGLLQMRERAEQLGGALQVETAPGQGVMIRVMLPALKL